MEVVGNRTGRWFVGVFALKPGADVNATAPQTATCQDNNFAKEDLAGPEDFGFTSYMFQTYTSGCYYFNRSSEVWESIGVSVNTRNCDLLQFSIYSNRLYHFPPDVQHV